MRQISTALQTLQQKSARVPAIQVLKEDWFWKFYKQSSAFFVTTTINKEIPQSFFYDGSNYTIFGFDSMMGYGIKYVVGSNGFLSSSAVFVNSSIHSSMFNGHLYYADESPYKLKRDGQNGSISTGLNLVNTNSLVQRVEAVVPVVEGADIHSSTLFYAYGTHDFDNKISNIAYYFCQNGNIRKLRTIIQMPLHGSKSSFSSFQLKSANFYALLTSEDEYLLVAQDTPTGRTICWTLKGGVESQPKVIVPIDHDLADIDFIASGLYKINGLYYITGMFSRNMTDGSKISYNAYLRSKDGLNWSIGEKAHFINGEGYVGNFDTSYTGSGTIRWLGNNTLYSANPLQSGIDITSSLYSIGINQQSNAGDTLEAEFSGDVAKNDILTVLMGRKDEFGNSQLVQIGKYVVDDLQNTMGEGGKSSYSITGRDLATACLSSKVSMDIQRESTLSVDSEIINFDNLIGKLFPEKAKAATSPLVHTGLNAPSVFYDGIRGSSDGIIRATAKFSSVTDYCQQSVSLIFGMDDTKFNAIVFPRHSLWNNAISSPQLRTSKLESWTQESGLLPFITDATKQFDNQGAYTSFSSSQIAPLSDTYYDFAVRTNGDRLQLFMKLHDNNLSTIASNSQWTYLSEHKLSSRERKAWGDSTYCGIALSTDVSASKEWFAQSAYGDLTVQLTEASEESGFKSKRGESIFTRLLNSPKNGNPGENWEGYEWSASSPGWVSVGADITKYQLGLAVKLHMFETQISKTHIEWGWVHAIDTANQRIQVSIDGKEPKTSPFSAASGTRLSLYVIDPSKKGDVCATAYSGYKVDAVFGVPVTTNNSVAKFPDSVGGRAAFVTDTSVFAPRWVKTDGISTTLRSPSPTSLIGFEQTTPVTMVYDAESETWNYWEARNWRMVFHHGLFFEGTCASKKLPNEGLFEVNDELILFKEYSFNRFGVYPLLGDTDTPTTWCAVPTLYSSLNAAPENSTVLSTWYNGGSYVGDNLSGSAGYLAEIVSKDSSGMSSIFEEGEQYYCQAATEHSITLDKPYPNEIIGISNDPFTQKKGDLLVLSGRGWGGTRKSLHSYDSVVKLYPSTVKLDGFISLKHFSVVRGLYNSSTSDLIGSLATYGVFNIETARLGNVTQIGNSQTSLASSAADFESIYKGHIYSDKYIYFNFRGYYQLDVYGVYENNRSKLALDLHAPQDETIQPGPKRFLECVRVDVSDIDTFSSSNIQHELRLIVKGNFIQVEFQGQLVWRFHLQEHPLRSNYGGNVYISSSSPITGIQAYINEIGDEMESHILDMGTAGTEALGYIISERYLKARCTADGGLHISRFLNRSTAPYTLEGLVVKDSQEDTGAQIPAHVRVSGAEIGEYLDANWIRDNGYHFDSGQNRLSNTVTESAEIAKTLVAMGIEGSYSNVIDTHFYADLEVEDKVSIAYSNPGDIYNRQPSEAVVISKISINGSPNSLSAIYSFRKSYV